MYKLPEDERPTNFVQPLTPIIYKVAMLRAPSVDVVIRDGYSFTPKECVSMMKWESRNVPKTIQ